MSTISEKVIKLQGQIFEKGYYKDEYLGSLARYNMTTASIEQQTHSDKDLIEMVNHFWLELPESREVRRDPFWLVCDIAEHIFDE